MLGPEAEQRKLTVGRRRKQTTSCMSARAENEGRLQPQKQWIRPAALAQHRQILWSSLQCPGSDSRDLNSSQELPAADLDTSRARQVGRVGYPAAEMAQVLKKGECFTLGNVDLTKPCSVLSCKPCWARWGTRGWTEGMRPSRLYFHSQEQVCPTAEHRHRKNEPFSCYSLLPWEGVHFSGLLKITSADSSWMLPSETFLPRLEGCPHSHAQGPYTNLLKLQKCKTECPSLLKWWHHGTTSSWLKKTNKKIH